MSRAPVVQPSPLSSLLAERALEVLRRAQVASGMSQRSLGEELTRRTGQKWPQSRVWKLLQGKMPITIPMYEVVAESLGLTFRDLVANTTESRLRHLTPDELRLLELVRQRGQATLEALFQLLDTPQARRRRHGLKP